jgi:hypothetical protein
MDGKVMLAVYAAPRYAGVNVTSPGAIRQLFGVTLDSAGNLPSMPSVFPD